MQTAKTTEEEFELTMMVKSIFATFKMVNPILGKWFTSMIEKANLVFGKLPLMLIESGTTKVSVTKQMALMSFCILLI